MAEEHKKSFMLYFDNFPCVAALDAEQPGGTAASVVPLCHGGGQGSHGSGEVLRQHPGLRRRPPGLPVSGGDIRRDTEKWKEKQRRYQEAAARRQGDGAISRQALEQAAPKDYSDIRKYLRDVSTAGRLPKSDP